MDFETLARKLEPLVPVQVRRWRRIHSIADPEMRTLIERQVQATAQRLLGDASRRILLSLPSPTLIKGAFNLGTVLYERDKWPAGLEHGEILQGVGVFGRSGGGKTNAVFHLLIQLAERRIPFLFLDWKRTGRHLLPLVGGRINIYTPGRAVSEFPFNPFAAPPGFERDAYAGLVADQLAAAYTLGDGAIGLIQRALKACFDRGAERGSCSLTDLITEIEGAKGHARVKGWQASAVRALRSLEFANVVNSGGPSPEWDTSQEDIVRLLLHESSIVELDALPQGAKRFLIPLLCLWIYRVRMASAERERLRFVIVVEEAHHVLYPHPRGTHEGVMEMLLRQCRELGIGMIVVDQHPHLISSAALGNTYTTICFNLKDPSDTRKASAMMLVDDPGCFGLLPVGHAVVKLQDRWRRPFLVRFPKLDVPKGAVNDADVARWMAQRPPRSAGSAELEAYGGDSLREWGRVRRVPRADRVLLPDELRFIDDVLRSPDDGVKARYRRLGLSGHRGNGIKDGLVRGAWLEAAVVPVGKTRKIVLRPTKEARERLGLGSRALQREGIAHEYWKRSYARRLDEAGYAVRIEAPRNMKTTGPDLGCADIIATKENAAIIVEIETGRSDVVSNVRLGLRAGFAKVFVAATDRAALAAVEAALGRAGLLVPRRVEVVAAWQTGGTWPTTSETAA